MTPSHARYQTTPHPDGKEQMLFSFFIYVYDYNCIMMRSQILSCKHGMHDLLPLASSIILKNIQFDKKLMHTSSKRHFQNFFLRKNLEEKQHGAVDDQSNQECKNETD